MRTFAKSDPTPANRLHPRRIANPASSSPECHSPWRALLFGRSKSNQKTAWGFMTQSQRCTLSQPRSAHSPPGPPNAERPRVMGCDGQVSDNGFSELVANVMKRLEGAGLVTHSRSPLNVQPRIQGRSGSGAKEPLGTPMKGDAPTLRRRSPGGFSDYSFGRPKE